MSNPSAGITGDNRGLSMSELRESHAIVVGGSSGIGLATASALVRAGARVDVLGRDATKLTGALLPLGQAATPHAVDAMDEAALDRCLATIGGFDHLILAAGGGAAEGMFRGITEERFRAAFDAKFWVHLRCVRLSLGRVRQSVTFVTGGASRRAMPGLSGLAATNGALHAMIGPLSLELAPVRVNAVSPGLVDTPYWSKMPEAQRSGLLAGAAARLPVGRVGSPEDLAQAVLFVVANGFTTGAIIDCDGGARHI